MNLKQTILRLSLATVVLGTLGGCAVVPYPQGYHRAPPVYVETYPSYGAPANGYYGSGRPYYDNRGGRHYEDRRYEERRHHDAPLPPPLQLHRDLRRSLGLPRLPGMP
jgi:hypothetical protein